MYPSFFQGCQRIVWRGLLGYKAFRSRWRMFSQISNVRFWPMANDPQQRFRDKTNWLQVSTSKRMRWATSKKVIAFLQRWALFALPAISLSDRTNVKQSMRQWYGMQPKTLRKLLAQKTFLELIAKRDIALQVGNRFMTWHNNIMIYYYIIILLYYYIIILYYIILQTMPCSEGARK